MRRGSPRVMSRRPPAKSCRPEATAISGQHRPISSQEVALRLGRRRGPYRELDAARIVALRYYLPNYRLIEDWDSCQGEGAVHAACVRFAIAESVAADRQFRRRKTDRTVIFSLPV